MRSLCNSSYGVLGYKLMDLLVEMLKLKKSDLIQIFSNRAIAL